MPDKRKQPQAGGGEAAPESREPNRPAKPRSKPEGTRVSTNVEIRGEGADGSVERIPRNKLRDGN